MLPPDIPGSTTMVTRLEIAVRHGYPDPRGIEIANKIRAFLDISVGGVRTRDVYRIDADLTHEEAAKILDQAWDLDKLTDLTPLFAFNLLE